MNRTIESLLCDIHQKNYALLVGNATTSLVIAIKSLGIHGQVIGIPNSVCIHVPLAVILSGNVPHYFDVNMHDFGIDVNALDDFSGKIAAVIAVHAYGSICEIHKIKSWCKSNQIALIEDLAVAQGASVQGHPVGSFGDIAVLSFGAGKIIDVSHGGAILTNDKSIMGEILRHVSGLEEWSPSFSIAQQEFGNYHTSLYNNFYGSGKVNLYCDEFRSRALKLESSTLCKFSNSYRSMILEQLENLMNIVYERRARASFFEEMLLPHSNKNFILCGQPHGSVPWRFNMLVEDRDKILRTMLSKKIKVSSWFPPADLFFENRSASKVFTPTSDYIGKMILNIWVNQEIDDNYSKAVIDELVSHAQRIADC